MNDATDRTRATLPPPPAHVHFVGVGGIGMSGLARILRAWGYRVTGSDSAASPLTDALAEEGIEVNIGHTATDRAVAANLVVMTAAVPEANPEVAAARAAGNQIVKRAELLGALMNARAGVAVAGSHGKSTTSGMLASALLALGAQPSYAIGAVLAATGTNAAPGAGRFFVAEADEYDHSFFHLAPRVAIVTNIEYDHPDIFPDPAAYEDAFARFVGGIRPEGALVLAADDPGCRRLLAREDLKRPARMISFGEEAGADWTLARGADGWVVTAPDGRATPLPLAAPGRHNARNATAALAALDALGFDRARAAEALAAFSGVGRRFEGKGEAAGVVVVDDYAHHPTEIRATLAAARERYPERRLWAVFQPHTYSRLKALLPEFGAAFSGADRVGILDVYAARERDTLGVGSDDLRALAPGSLAMRDPTDAAQRLAALVEPGDVVLTLGAGSVTEVGPQLLRTLEARAAAPGRPARPAPVRPRRAKPEGLEIPGRPGLKALRDSPMRLHTTWRIGGPADFLVRAPTPDDVLAAVRWGAEQGLPITTIGGGSNLLVGDGGIRGLVILIRTPGERAEHLAESEDLGDRVRLRLAAQAPLSWSGRYAAERGWAGLDWGVGLPGTIGGATVNNAGAHGVEQKDHLVSVTLLDLETGEVVEQPAAWMEAAYRHTVIKAAPRPRRWIVLAATMELPKGDPAELVRLAEEHADFRKRTQPTGACSGSTFANPPGDFAGRLLEEAGMKGVRVGGAEFSPKHANWIINDGTATAADARALLAEARSRVRERFGVDLRQEVEDLGEPDGRPSGG